MLMTMIQLSIIQRIRRKSPDKIAAFIQRHGEKRVRIYSGQWGAFWRENRSGYTFKKEEAGVYSIEDAFDATCHCGPEKFIKYDFIRAS